MISLDKKFIFMHVPKTAGTSVENSVLSNHAYYFESEYDKEMNAFLQSIYSKLIEEKKSNFKDGKIINKSELLGKHFSMHEYYQAFTGPKDFDKYFSNADFADRNRNPLNDFYKFTIIRNPWDRALSYYFWLVQDFDKENFKSFLNLGQKMEVSADTPRPDYFKKVEHPITKELAYHPYNLFSISSWLGIDFSIYDRLIRYENLESDFSETCEDLGIEYEKLPHFNKTEGKEGHYSQYYDEETKEIVARSYADDIENFGYEYETV